MKKIYLFLLFLFVFSAFGQQKGISYQAVIINPNAIAAPGFNGTSIPLANKAICMSFQIVNSTNQVEYQESQSITTDVYGMINVVIGTGTLGTGLASTLEAVNWNLGTKKLVVGVNTEGTCSNYTEISNQVLNYTPYSFYAQNADIKDGYVTDVKVAMGINPVKVGLGNVNNTSDANKPVSSATQTALNLKANTTDVTASLVLKEDQSNKSAITTLGTSDVLFPTQNAVKSYVDTSITAINTSNAALQATVASNATAATTAIAAVQANLDVNVSASNTADVVLQSNIATLNNTVTSNAATTTTTLALKEDQANKSSITTLGTSDILFPTQNAVKSYVDTAIASATIVDADYTTKGKIKLAGDLAGTSDLPIVPGLALKANALDVTTALNLKANDADVSTGLALKLDASQKGIANGLATLNSAGIIPSSQLPPVTISSTNVVGSDADMTSLTTATVGSIAIRTDLNKNYVLSATDSSIISNWIELLTPAAPVQTVNGYVGSVNLTKTDIDLGNVDNTSDRNKPISDPTQIALNLKSNTSDVDAAMALKINRIEADAALNLKLNANKVGLSNGVASLNALGKIPTEQIPAISFSSVKVLSNQADMLALSTAVIGSVVIRTDVNKNYVLAQADPSNLANWIELLTPAPPVQSVNGYTGSVSLSKTDFDLANVNNTSDNNKPISTATQTALDLKVSRSSLAAVATTGDYRDLLHLPSAVDASSLSGTLAIAKGGTGSTTQNFVDLTTTQSIAGRKTFTSNITFPTMTSYGDIVVNGISIGSNSKGGNTLLGYQALIYGAASGGSNTAIGSMALYATSGNSNTAVGSNAMRGSASGNDNTAIGSSALGSGASGSRNTGVGAGTMTASVGDDNVALGYNSGRFLATGSQNTFIGNQADLLSGVNSAVVNSTAIGYNAKVSANNSIQLGNLAVTNVKTSGTITAGDVTYPKTHGTTGQVLSTTGSGALVWATPISSATSLTGTLAVANGGTGASTLTGLVKGNGIGAMTDAVAGTDYLVPTGSAASLTNFPILNQNTTGTATNVSGIVSVANGGTGATTAATAMENLLGLQPANTFMAGSTSPTVTISAFDGSSLTGWTNSGGTTIDGSNGNPGSTYKTVGPNQSFYRDFGQSLKNKIIEFDIKLTSGVAGFAIGGLGNLGLKIASGTSSINGIVNHTSWQYPNSSNNTFTFIPGTWYAIKIVTDNGAVGGTSWYVNGILIGNSGGYAMGDGTLFGILTDGATAYYDNIVIKEISTIGAIPAFRAIVAADIPTLNQNTTGTASNVSGTIAVANGGTGTSTLTGLVKGNGIGAMTAAVAGTDYLVPTGSAASLTNFPILNQNTTGTAANVTGIVSVANGGTGASNATAALANLTGTQPLNYVLAGPSSSTTLLANYDGSSLTDWTIPAGGITIDNSNGNSAPSIKSIGSNKSAYRDLSQNFKNKIIQFDIKMGVYTKGGFNIGTNSSGAGGLGLTLKSGTTSDNGLNLGSGNWYYTNNSGNTFTFTPETWYSIKIVTDNGAAGGVSWYVDNVLVGNSGGYAIGNDSYYGIINEGGTVNIDNIIITSIATVSVPSFRTLVAADIPTLNQSTTGTASNVSGIVSVANGGTGSSTQNFMNLTTAQTVGGAKTFSSNVTLPAIISNGDILVNGITIGSKNGGASNNTLMGKSALISLSSGIANTAIGSLAMYASNGSSNTAVGTDAMRGTVSGDGNTAIGASALGSSVSGSRNTGIGGSAMTVVTGNDNASLGYFTGKLLTTGSQNTFIGVNADVLAVANSALVNSTAIGYNAKVSANNSIQLGNTDISDVKTSGKLTTGTVTYPNIHNAIDGQVLTTNAAGVASWKASGGGTHTINETFGGGIVFYVTTDGLHGLIAETIDQSTPTCTWYNAQDIISNPANHSVQGQKFTDWRLPTKYELNLMFIARSTIGGFTTDYYWSSTETDYSVAVAQSFTDGFQVTTASKGNQAHVHAVRAF